ncbi:hypothetical protein [Subtercola boreus]|uniref:Integral membrane protein n=1 Tax=Subtercola boreus TaxID=120213 RepID=A0A3E0WB75_9MICO|nr:hypothetical protein [Subtercola boreus]RFA20236.1 hypothetical protein B7R24_09495 [Subtercola boreus]RFA20388.1 hypothetical protein B7R23_09430 [Subtercola boreus]RFA26640.1 hypothetical protein B7R25_09560 [Subtercola boreus]
MIEWFSYVQIAIAVLAGVFCLVVGFTGRTPNDFTLGSTALVEVLLVIQFVVALLSPAFGNTASGDVLEFYVYAVSALLLPAAAVFWALIDRTKWSTVILGVACLAIAVMVYRMNAIWLVQGV